MTPGPEDKQGHSERAAMNIRALWRAVERGEKGRRLSLRCSHGKEQMQPADAQMTRNLSLSLAHFQSLVSFPFAPTSGKHTGALDAQQQSRESSTQGTHQGTQFHHNTASPPTRLVSRSLLQRKRQPGARHPANQCLGSKHLMRALSDRQRSRKGGWPRHCLESEKAGHPIQPACTAHPRSPGPDMTPLAQNVALVRTPDRRLRAQIGNREDVEDTRCQACHCGRGLESTMAKQAAYTQLRFRGRSTHLRLHHPPHALPIPCIQSWALSHSS
mmetsp:Transcript_26733/g.58967  ORF Transcript_26733/g.58967 Transcript_26733/m.58967 type:complete len:272 (-) Transcript_26733:526-1341(-)